MAEKNKFWGASSSSDSDGGSDDEAKVETKATQRQMGGQHHFIIDSDTESEDEGRVVRSAKDKRWGEMRAVCKQLIHMLHISDWNGIGQGAWRDVWAGAVWRALPWRGGGGVGGAGSPPPPRAACLVAWV